MLSKLVAITQKFPPPFYGENVQIHSAFRRAEFGKCYERAIGVSMTTTVKFVLILSFGWSLSATEAYDPSGRERAWRENRNDIDHQLQDIGAVEGSWIGNAL